MPMTATTAADLVEDERLGLDWYDRKIRPTLRIEDDGKYVAVDVRSGEFEIDADDYAATGRLLNRVPAARIWLLRAGRDTTCRIGRRIATGAE
jgi:hypothetical protein